MTNLDKQHKGDRGGRRLGTIKRTSAEFQRDFRNLKGSSGEEPIEANAALVPAYGSDQSFYKSGLVSSLKKDLS